MPGRDYILLRPTSLPLVVEPLTRCRSGLHPIAVLSTPLLVTLPQASSEAFCLPGFLWVTKKRAEALFRDQPTLSINDRIESGLDRLTLTMDRDRSLGLDHVALSTLKICRGSRLSSTLAHGGCPLGKCRSFTNIATTHHLRLVALPNEKSPYERGFFWILSVTSPTWSDR